MVVHKTIDGTHLSGKQAELLLAAAMSMLTANRGSVFISNPDREEMECVAFHAPERAAGGSAERQLANRVSWSGKPLVVLDYDQDTFLRESDGEAVSAAAVIIPGRGGPIGVLCLVSTDASHRFCPSDLNQLEQLVRQAATDIENAVLQERLEKSERLHRELLRKMISAQEDERKKIASDIHDDTIQMLISNFYQLEGLEMLIRQGAANETFEELSRTKESFQRAIVSMRHLLFNLRPSILDDAGLLPALEVLLNWFEEQTGIVATLYADETVKERAGSMLEISFYRVAQEILANVRKHSNASEVMVRVTRHAGGMMMRISDNGIGFEPEGVLAGWNNDGHFGLRSVIERVEVTGGRIQVRSSPGEGTEVVVSIPEGIE
jgi:signal transduction histidine kinase